MRYLVTGTVSAGAVDIVLGLRMVPEWRLKAVSASNLTTGYLLGGIYVGPAWLHGVAQFAQLPDDTLAEALALVTRAQGPAQDVLTWSGDLPLDGGPTVLYICRYCVVGDRLRMAVEVEPR